MHTCVMGMPLNAWGVYRKGIQFYLAMVVATVTKFWREKVRVFLFHTIAHGRCWNG